MGFTLSHHNVQTLRPPREAGRSGQATGAELSAMLTNYTQPRSSQDLTPEQLQSGRPAMEALTCAVHVGSDGRVRMILPQVHLRKPCYDFSFL